MSHARRKPPLTTPEQDDFIQNLLYSYLEHDQAACEAFCKANHPVTEFSALQASTGREYFLLKLRVAAQFVQDLRVREHHISIDKNLLDGNVQRDYHYTATLERSEQYKLHVYFARTATPHVTLTNEFGKSVEIDTLLEQKFIELARCEAHPIVCALWQLRNDTVSRLKREYADCNLQATQYSLHSHQLENYLSALRAMQEKLRELLQLINEEYYRAHDKMIRNMIEYSETQIQQAIQKTASPASSTLAITDASTTAQSQPVASTSIALKKLTTKSKVAIDSSKLQTGIELIKKLESAASFITEEENKALNEMARYIHDTLLQYEETSQKADAISLRTLHQASSALQNFLCQVYLEQAIVLKKTTWLATMPGLGALLQEKHFSLAVMWHDSALLDYVLSQVNFSVNTQPVTIGNTVYKTAIHYYLESSCLANANTKEIPSFQACLSVLMKHGASLMLQAEHGLPLIELIFQNNQHPFRHLTEIESQESSMLYKTLIAALENAIETHPKADAPALIKRIGEYRESMNMLCGNSSRLNALSEAARCTARDALFSPEGSWMSMIKKENPALYLSLEQLREQSKQVMAKLAKERRDHSAIRQQKDLFDRLSEVIPSGVNPTLQLMNKEQVFETVAMWSSKQSELLSLYCKNRRSKKEETRLQQLHKEINAAVNSVMKSSGMQIKITAGEATIVTKMDNFLEVVRTLTSATEFSEVLFSDLLNRLNITPEEKSTLEAQLGLPPQAEPPQEMLEQQTKQVVVAPNFQPIARP